MALVHKAPFGQTVRTFTAVATAAVGSLNTDTPTNTVLLATAGPEGLTINRLTAMTRATNTALALYVFLSKNGTTKHLIMSKMAPAHTVAATTEIPVVEFDVSALEDERLEAGDQLFVGIGATGSIVFRGSGMDY